MEERKLVKVANTAIKAAIVAGFVGIGICILFMVVKSSSRPEILEPFPLFGASLARLHTAVVIVYAGLWLFWTVVILREEPGALLICGFVAILMLVAGVGAVYGLDCANALLDFSSPVRTPVLVREVRRDRGKTIRGASFVVMATVSPADRPDQRFELNWNSCGVSSSEEVSPFGAVRIGRGALGAPWVALPVECRALAVGDRPFFGTFRLGSGPLIMATVERGEAASVRAMRAQRRAEMLDIFNGFINSSSGYRKVRAEVALSNADLALLPEERAELEKALEPLVKMDEAWRAKDIGREAIRIVNEDSRHQDPAYRLSVWMQGIAAVAPSVPKAIIRAGDGAGVLADFKCAGCSILSEDTVDMAIYRILTGQTEPGLGGSQIFVIDGAGRVAFKAKLSETSLVPTLAQSLRTVLPNK
jgi:hypothetical protein